MGTVESRCPYCKQRPADPAWRPFCSERCKMADLGRWLTGDYRVPGDTDQVPNADEEDPDSGDTRGED